jgi:hypothetical protein
LNGRHPSLAVSLLVVIILVGWSTSGVAAQQTAPTVQNTAVVSGDGTATWTADYNPNSPDYTANREAYDSLGDSAYKDAFIATLSATCGWTVSKSSMTVTFPTGDSMQVRFRINDFGERINSTARRIDLTCLRNAGFTFEGSSEDGRSYQFLADEFCDLMVCSGPYALNITLPAPIQNITFNESEFQIQFRSQPTFIPGFPIESILAGLVTGIIVLTLLGRKRIKAKTQ